MSTSSLRVRQVHDWGTGDQERLGELRVKKVEPLYRDPATADAAPAAAAAPATQAVIGGAAVLEPPPAEQLGAAQAGRREGPSAARRGEGGAADAPQPPPKDMYGLLCHEMAMAEVRVNRVAVRCSHRRQVGRHGAIEESLALDRLRRSAGTEWGLSAVAVVRTH